MLSAQAPASPFYLIHREAMGPQEFDLFEAERQPALQRSSHRTVMETAMSYQLRLSGDGHFVSCRVAGPISAERGRTCVTAMIDFGRERNIKRFLIDVRKVRNMSTATEDHDFANKALEAMGWTRDLRSALLIAADDTSHDFLEIVAQNAGYLLRIFRDEQSAIDWLENGAPGQDRTPTGAT